ncbi:polyprenyl synthetase family protein [Streptomyces apocyni]|uniref:polyprenyl synthetase family protein n=1 Tax=Streptomyces apocyni TaxID=2654677 RepID=UPI0018D1B1BF|nr:polyprenyl synthetase family protein [Streptomyces apocyni]
MRRCIIDITGFFAGQPLDIDMGRMGHILTAESGNEHPHLDEIQGYYIKVRGKQLRPILAFAPWYLRHPGTEIPVSVAGAGAVVELLHTGSLYHDDVMDGALVRRGQPSANAKWGDSQAILAGNILTMRAFAQSATLGERAHTATLRTYERMCAGQSLEIRFRFDTTRATDNYLQASHGKTASLISLACRLGAQLSDYDAHFVDRFAQFGESLGMAFQICDDILDFVADPVLLGKSTGSDVLEGTYSLPLIYALEKDPSLAELLTEQMDPRLSAQVSERVRACGAVDRAYAVAGTYIAEATDVLDDLPDSGPCDPGVLAGLRALSGEVLRQTQLLTPAEAPLGSTTVA